MSTLIENPLVEDLNCGGFRVKNLGVPQFGGDAATKSYVDSTVSGSGSKGVTTPPQYVFMSSDWTFTLGDAGQFYVLVSGSHTFTIPLRNAVAYLLVPGSAITITNAGTGVLTIAVAGGVTLNGNLNGSAVVNSFKTAVILPITPDNWIIVGAFS